MKTYQFFYNCRRKEVEAIIKSNGETPAPSVVKETAKKLFLNYINEEECLFMEMPEHAKWVCEISMGAEDKDCWDMYYNPQEDRFFAVNPIKRELPQLGGGYTLEDWQTLMGCGLMGYITALEDEVDEGYLDVSAYQRLIMQATRPVWMDEEATV